MKKSVFSLFAQAQMSYSEAEEKAKQEAGKPKVDRFRIGEDGEYTIRLLPLAPSFDENGEPLPMERKGYEYPIRQLFLGINLPTKKGKKPKKINVPVIRATDKGIGKSVDLIDTYVRIAKELYADDEELLETINSGSYTGGLRWSYQHVMYVLDLTEAKNRAKGPQLWQCSNSQYRTLNDAGLRLWRELREDGEQNTCPISWFTNAYPVKVIRHTDKKTEYDIEIGRKTVDVTEAEIEKLLDLPRIPEYIYRFSRYQLEAEVVFLQQYDEAHQMEVCKEPDFIEAVEKLKGEMAADDTSHFDIANAGSDKGGASAEVTIDSLWAEYDHIVDEGLSEKSDEYQELREKIRQFAEDNELDVRLARSKNNQQLLEEIENAMEDKKGQASATNAAVKEEAAEEEQPAAEETEEETEAKEEAPVRRRSRPTIEDAEEEAEKAETADTKDETTDAPTDDANNGDEEAAQEAEPTLRRRRRR